MRWRICGAVVALLLTMVVSVSAWAEAVGGPLLNNRFRLDHGIEEVSLIIYRDRGSEASILVQPDGSKIYVTTEDENVAWYDDVDFDLITIRKPMPGPWQVIGKVDPRNRWEILSDVQLVLDEEPTQLFAQERVKMTARIVNRGKVIDLAPFLKELKLEVWIRRAGATDKYGLEYNALKIGEYLDDGTVLDEVPGDGVFTANLNLQATPDQYQLIFRAFNPTFERTTETSLRLLPLPLAAEIANEQGRAVAVTVDLDPAYLVADDMTVSGDILVADGRRLPFAARGDRQGRAIYRFDYLQRAGEYGVECVVNAVGRDGKPRVFVPPPLRFALEAAAPTPQEKLLGVGGSSLPSRDENPLQAVLQEMQGNFERELDDLKEARKPVEPAVSPLLVISGFALLLVLTLVAIFIVLKVRARKALEKSLTEKALAEAARKQKEEHESIDLTLPEG